MNVSPNQLTIFEGHRQSITISVGQYDPVGVECLDPVDGAPPESGCELATQLMTASISPKIFGPQDFSWTQVPVPQGFIDCKLFLHTDRSNSDQDGLFFYQELLTRFRRSTLCYRDRLQIWAPRCRDLVTIMGGSRCGERNVRTAWKKWVSRTKVS